MDIYKCLSLLFFTLPSQGKVSFSVTINSFLVYLINIRDCMNIIREGSEINL